MTQLQKHLRDLGACEEGLEFAGDRTADAVWTTCSRPGWLGWWLAKTNTEPENRRLAKLYCRIWNEYIAQLLPEFDRPDFQAMLAAIAYWCDDPTYENRKKARALAIDVTDVLILDLTLSIDLAIALTRYLARDLARAIALILTSALACARTRDRALDKKWCNAIRSEFVCPFKEAA